MMWRKRSLRPAPLTDSVIRYGPEPKERRHWADILEDAIKRGARGLLDNYEIMALWWPPIALGIKYPPPEHHGWPILLTQSACAVLAVACTVRRMK